MSPLLFKVVFIPDRCLRSKYTLFGFNIGYLEFTKFTPLYYIGSQNWARSTPGFQIVIIKNFNISQFYQA